MRPCRLGRKENCPTAPAGWDTVNSFSSSIMMPSVVHKNGRT
ncbi:hypothetical protein [Lysobacter gummosus]